MVNIISIAGKLAEPEHPPVELNSDRCVHERDRLAQCDLCVRACPVDALHVDAHITLDEKMCVACGLCVHTCPVGAFKGDDGFIDLLNLVGRLPENSIIELACPRHPAPQNGENENASVIRTKMCLAALGTSRYLQLLVRVPQLIVRTDACAECVLGRARPAITQAVDSARSVLAARGEAEQLIEVNEKPTTAKTRAVYDAKNPPVSRRDLLRVFVTEGSKVAARALDSADESAAGKTPPLERRRLINVLRQFVPIEMPEWQPVPASNLGLVRLAADNKCTACGICARACPTGAMQFVEGENNSYRLTITPAQCTNCGICLDLCDPKSLQRNGVPTFGELLGAEPQVLRTGTLKECYRCKQKFADHIEGNLCSVCAYRKANPFGSRMLPVVKPRAK